MTASVSSTFAGPMPIELTAPAIQRLARKGLQEPLTEPERKALCECIVFHIDAILDQRSIPKVSHLKRSPKDRA